MESIEYQLAYRQKKIRLFEEAVANEYGEQQMRCPVHLSIGQEAVPAAIGVAMREDDLAVSSHRAHGHFIGKGGNTTSMIAEFYGKKTGCSSGKGGSMHLVDESVGFMGSTAIVGNTIPVGVGLGLSIKLKKTDQISIVFLGDGACEEGAFYESANFAVLKNLPVLFVCENNFYSVYSPLKVRQPEGRQIYKMAEGIGLKSYFCNGNKVDDCYDLIKRVAAEIRAGSGPQFIEFETYRWREHCGPNYDNHIGYRAESEFEEWKKKDPVAYYENKMIQEGTLTKAQLDKIDKEIRKEIQVSFDQAKSAPFPGSEEAFTDLYWSDRSQRSIN